MVKRLFLIIAMFMALIMPGYCADRNNWGNTDVDPLLRRELPYDLVYNGVGRGGVSTITTGFTSLTPSMALAKIYITTRTLTIADGEPGQILPLVAYDLSSGASLTITATTKTGWASATMDAAYDSLTLLYVDDTYGWIVIGQNSVTVS